MNKKSHEEEANKRVDEQVRRNEARIDQRYSMKSSASVRQMTTRERYVQTLAVRRMGHHA